MKKGITPVISLIMLMLITVGIVGIAYAWFSGLTTGATEEAISIPPGGAYCYKLTGNNYIGIMVQNNGAQSNILQTDIIVATINGVDCTPNLLAASFPITPSKATLVIKQAGSAANCGSGSAFAAGTYPVVIGTKANLVQTQVICK